ncbi:MAG: hypothetical protein KJ970_08105 [Candidatus Eisenbacteria bacterium]|uniref:Uncharacterized protein n=1 Tax=Eiseniibacteriota bacterium TaxID=2212470 RepID=A0A948W697_UNCEI|nr:hypothetical protein [Candidatus Eisenbacteria bacterium]
MKHRSLWQWMRDVHPNNLNGSTNLFANNQTNIKKKQNSQGIVDSHMGHFWIAKAGLFCLALKKWEAHFQLFSSASTHVFCRIRVNRRERDPGESAQRY